MSEGRTLIVGAGLAGLALGAALRRAGRPYEIVERRAPGDHDGAGLQLAGNAVRVLAALGLARTLADRAYRAESLHYTDAAGATLFRIDLARRFPRWPFFGVLRGELRALLLEAAGPENVRYETSVAGLHEHPDRIEVGFQDGSEDGFALVVGADGIGSPLRQRIFPEARREPFGSYWSWRFVAPCPADLREPCFMLGVERTLLLYPVGRGRLYGGAGPIRMAGEPPRGAALLPWLRDAYSGFGGHAERVLAGLDDPAALAASRVESVRLGRWHRGHVLLIGDAAHACPPTLAQGAAQALEDAQVLAYLLSEGGTPSGTLPALEGTLRAFEQRRRPRVEAVQAASRSRMTVTEVREPAPLAIRDALLRQIGAERLDSGWRPWIDVEP